MIVNGFVAGAFHISKHSLFLVTLSITNNLIVSAVSTCRDSITVLSKNIAHYIASVFVKDSEGMFNKTSENDGDSSKGEERAASSDKAYVKELKRNEAKVKTVSVLSGVSARALYAMWEAYKIPDISKSGLGGAFILFIVFVAAVRQRKNPEDINSILSLSVITEKIKISA
jgi:hypothetical protein